MTEIKKLELEERRRELLPREEVHVALARMAGILRQCGEALRREYGNGAGELLDAHLEDFRREMKSGFEGSR